MTAVDDGQNAELTQLLAPGSAVLTAGRGDDDVESLAVWQISATGAPTGAWVVPCAETFGSPVVARRLLSVIERRAVAVVQAELVESWLEQLTTAGGIEASVAWWKGQLFSPATAFAETVDRRRRYAATVSAAREDGKSITALEWAHDLPDDTPVDDFAALQGIAGIRCAPGSPVVSDVLTVARTLRWLVSVWAETEQVKSRRRYVRAEHGDPDQLPPSWLRAVRTASATRLPL